MASGTISLGRDNHLTGQIVWTATANGTVANTSTITATLQVARYYGSSTPTSGTFSGALNIGGTSKSFSVYKTVSTSWITVLSFSVTKAHNSDGTGTCYISGQIDGPTGTTMEGRSVYANKTVTLDTIPRAATITSAPNFNDEANPTISYSNPAGDSVDSLEACISLDGSWEDIAYRSISKTDASYTFNLTDAERSVLRNATTDSNSRSVRFYVRTTIGGTEYLSYLAKTLSIVNANPTISPTIVDTNSVTVALTGDSSKMVRFYSNAQITMGVAALKGASITSKKVSCGNKSLTADGTINAVESGSFVFTATDSRGNTTSKTVNSTLVNYVKLTCSLGNNKPDAVGNMTVQATGNCFNGSFGSVSNTLSVYYRYKLDGGEYGDWITMAVVQNGNSYTATADLTGLDYQSTYVFEAYAVDKLVTVYASEKRIKTTPVFDWGESDFNINGELGLNSAGTVLRRNVDNGNIVLSAPDATDGIFLRPNGTGSAEGQAVLSKNGSFKLANGLTVTDGALRLSNGDFHLANAKIFYGTNTSGAERSLVQLNASNQMFFGYGGYSNNEGSSFFDGNSVYIRSNGAVRITSPTAGLTEREYGVCKTLWSGGYYMHGTQTITLSEAISAQPHGIVLVFSYYANGGAANAHFNTFFIPKGMVAAHGGVGYSFPLFTANCNVAANKYLYISDTEIAGYANNSTGATNAGIGIIVTNSSFVLRYVFGV